MLAHKVYFEEEVQFLNCFNAFISYSECFQENKVGRGEEGMGAKKNV